MFVDLIILIPTICMLSFFKYCLIQDQLKQRFEIQKEFESEIQNEFDNEFVKIPNEFEKKFENEIPNEFEKEEKM